jgi:hypothetical protein
VLTLVDAEILDRSLDLPAVHLGRERGLLQLLAHRLGLHPLDPGGTDQRARRDEPGQLVDREQGLRHPGLTWNLEELRVPGHRVDHFLRVPALPQLLQRDPRVPRVEVGIPLVVEIVDDARDRPQLLVLAVLARVGPHRRLHAQGVLAKRVGLGPLAEQLPGVVASRFSHGPLLP